MRPLPRVLVVGDRVLVESRQTAPGAFWELRSDGTCPCPALVDRCAHIHAAEVHLAALLGHRPLHAVPDTADDVFDNQFVHQGYRP